MKTIIALILLLLLPHSQMHWVPKDAAKSQTISVYTPVERERRNLQANGPQSIRIHIQNVDPFYSHNSVTDLEDKLMEISKTFFQMFLKVVRVPLIAFPADNKPTCNSLVIPSKYIEGKIQFQPLEADLGVIYGNKIDTINNYLVSSIPCAQYNGTGSNRMRPIWAATSFNIASLKAYFTKEITQQEFQYVAYKSIHELMHALAFSPSLFLSYAGINTRGWEIENAQIELTKQLKIGQFIGCQRNITFNAFEFGTHWKAFLVEDEIMSQNFSSYPYISDYTVKIFELSGWYPEINRDLAQPSRRGKGKGCSFYEQETCYRRLSDYQKQEQFECDYGLYSSIKRKFDCLDSEIVTDSRCLREEYQSELSSKTAEVAGRYSGCFKSDLREKGTTLGSLLGRCYRFTCISKSGRQYLLLEINKSFYYCLYEGYHIYNIPGYDGRLQCPQNFDEICSKKEVCRYGCGLEGICVRGKCMCRGSTALQTLCPNPNI